MTTRLEPFPYQEESIQRALAEPTHGVLIASGLGSGKTLVASEIAVRLNLARVLIVAPRNTLAQWAERIPSQGGPAVRRLDSTAKGKTAWADFRAGAAGYYSATIQWLVAQDFTYRPYILNGEPQYKPNGDPETERIHLKTFAKVPPLDGIIFDEFHAIQSRKALAVRTMRTIKTDWRIGLSGTWHGNGFDGAWATSQWVWPDLVDASYHRWVGEWCTTEDLYVGRDKPVTKVVGEKTPGAYVASLPCYILDEPFPDIPAAEALYVDITPAQRAQYDQLEQDALAWVRDHEGVLQPTIADLPIVLRQRLRTATLGELSVDENGEILFADDCQSAKLTALRGVLDWVGGPVVVFMQSKRFARVVAKRMSAAGYRTALWTGDQTEKQRNEIKRGFVDGTTYDYIVATIGSLREGLDSLQHRCSTIVWVERSEDQIANQQAAGRIWRPGVDQAAFRQVDVLARDTRDDETYVRLQATRGRNLAHMGSRFAA